MNRAVFLDRDGTINEEKNYLCRVEEVVLFPGAAAALSRLQQAGYKLFIGGRGEGERAFVAGAWPRRGAL